MLPERAEHGRALFTCIYGTLFFTLSIFSRTKWKCNFMLYAFRDVLLVETGPKINEQPVIIC